MATLDWELDRTDGVTLVRLYVTAEYDRRVRIENRLDGPVWPPRRQGQPAAGWDDDAFEGTVTPDGRLVVGYATPAQPAEPPAAIVSDEPADTGPDTAGTRDSPATTGTRHVTASDGGDASPGTEPGGADSVERTPAGVVRSLGDPTVPRDAVPVPEIADSTGAKSNGSATEDGVGETTVDESTANQRWSETTATGESGTATTDESGAAVSSEPVADDDSGGRPFRGANHPQQARLSSDAVPVVSRPVRAWLRDVERRLDTVERRGPETVDPGNPLGITVKADSLALGRVARRVETLSERAERLQHERRSHASADGAR